MKRCLQLAAMGTGRAAPNPLVGSVVVHNNSIIGEGYHQQCGGPHAEVNAIASVKHKELLSEATIYVNLEPCAHFGKTPPCADLIVQHRLKRVVMANRDPFAQVDGRGIAKLKEAGIEVTTSVMEQEGAHLNRRFFTFHTHKRPYIILKWAQSADGFIDWHRNTATQQKPLAISGKESQRWVHQWRSQEAGILIGSGTALLDNPRLDVRRWSGNSPVRLVLDRSGKLPVDLHLMDGSVRTMVFSANQPKSDAVEWMPTSPTATLAEVMDQLYAQNIQSILVEGGATIHQQLLLEGLWDEARVWQAEKLIGSGVPAPTLPGKAHQVHQVGKDRCFTFYKAEV